MGARYQYIVIERDDDRPYYWRLEGDPRPGEDHAVWDSLEGPLNHFEQTGYEPILMSETRVVLRRERPTLAKDYAAQRKFDAQSYYNK